MEEQLRHIDELCQSATSGGTDVLLLPELSSTPYFPVTEDSKNFGLAEDLDGPSLAAMRRLATRHDCYVIGGLFLKRGDEYFNSAPVVDRAGDLMGVYDKTHVPRIETSDTRGFEDYYFTPGRSLPVWELGDVTTGVLICYDRSFAEAWRVQTLAGASVIYVLASSSGFRAKAFVTELQTRALENGVWVVAVNKAGLERGPDEFPVAFYGRSCVISPTGDIEVELGDAPDTYFTFELDLGRPAQARERLPLLRDRRPDLYHSVSTQTEFGPQ